MRLNSALLPLTLAALLALAACDNAEDRAEAHFQSALGFVAEGDSDRALVELRNVFRLDGAHRDARHLFAELMLARGEVGEAYSHWLRQVEFHPEDLPARLALAEIALEDRAIAEAERHGRAAQQIAPEHPRVRAVVAALDYRAAIEAGDAAARAAIATEAQAVLELDPEALPARMVLIDQLVSVNAPEEGLRQLDAALAQAPQRRDLNEARFQLLMRLGDDDGAGQHLAEMQARFPQDEMLREAVVVWHLQRERPERAEAFLRALVEADPADLWAPLSLVEVLRLSRGAEAAAAEIDALLAAGGDPVALRSALAELARAEGRSDDAIAELSDLVATEPAGQARHDAEVRLARMLLAEGREDEARARIAAVLEVDTAHVGALKMHARWLIREDRPGEAISALRRALTQEPRDAEIMLLLADAHLRDGSRDLAAERLALAVEVSGRAALPSLRHAGFLAEQGRTGAAEAVLEDALRVAPRELRLLVALGELRVRSGDFDRARRTIADLRDLGTPEALRAADALQAGLLARTQPAAATATFLRNLIDRGEDDLATVALLVQTRIAEGDLDGATEELEALMAGRPGDMSLRFLRAGLHQIAGEAEAAEAIYRALMAEVPGAEGPPLALLALLEAQPGREAEAEALLDAALAEVPGSVQLRWHRASRHEAAGDTEAAIALYEQLYAENTANAVFANNLAALLSNAREDDASLERAFVIARRLRSSEVPAFRDTYGWIEHRRGNHAEALRHLEFAAAGMPDAPVVQFHFGMTLAALDRGPEASAALSRALDLGLGPARSVTARDTLAGLEAAAEAEAAAAGGSAGGSAGGAPATESGQ